MIHSLSGKGLGFGLALLVLAFASLLNPGCRPAAAGFAGKPAPSHEAWDRLLSRHVGEDGLVDYQGFINDSLEFRAYLKLLKNNPPDPQKWSREAQMAFWINAYNAFTIDIVVRHYPLKSIRDIGPKLTLPFVNTVWDIKFIKIGGEKLDLNRIEHRKLRKGFGDPRIHFAIVCASISCPKLLNEAYTAEKLDEQLDASTRDFLADNSRNRITKEKLELSRIFNWYKGDFTKEGDLRGYIAQYTEVEIAENAEISFLDYDWGLNGR